MTIEAPQLKKVFRELKLNSPILNVCGELVS